MALDVDLLFTWGATASVYKRNEVIFNEAEMASFYYQILTGKVKMLNRNEDGKEFTQGYFYDGDSFGEPPLFLNTSYPSTAIAVADCKVLKLSKEKFLKILDEYPNLQKEFLWLMCQKLYVKTLSLSSFVQRKTEDRISIFLQAQKRRLGNNGTKTLIPFTRQEIANFTGLRVETVIRVLCKMKTSKKVDIINHKIYY